ncbi:MULTISPECIES: carbohydrate ABC transporter permease [Cellulosilyticum]|uniref:ABC-type transporter, integral membrane subunit n=1 Tax=Cellulosilyticum lentocellum (strain ATCC 49066 / DSM 5427 / NCIMB 11756 / RHM5) TaxID=642492 RepID=F2JM99_CELLD|nr:MULTISPECIES: carbohydrate ABC transporter permease [Cellulosilyticum]ADZ82310.1 ABC-type transporter, integral membrane subunit [Cellulosilyticum lentocellum DSM 5427]QEH67996.1 carbohydrate ABC transporter permease [Cellulosilyticum sp. WCF-2]
MGKRIVVGLKYLLLSIWTVICLFPIYWLVCFSLKDNTEIFGENIAGLPRHWIFSNYQSAFMGGNVGIYLLNSVIVTGMTILLTIIVAVTASYALERMVWKLRKTAMTIFMIGIMIPIHAALLPVFYMMQTLHILNTAWSLIIPYVAFAMPVAIMIMTGFVAGIPRELEESASIDGASIYKIFISVILPLLKPAIATVSIFTFIQAWNELMFATVFISNNAKKTLTVGIQSMSGQFLTQWGPIGAALVVATIPTIMIYLLLNRQVQDSLVMGAVKG